MKRHRQLSAPLANDSLGYDFHFAGNMNEIFSDGFLYRSNPSAIGGGFTLVSGKGELMMRKRILRKGLTSNEAELLGIVRAVELSVPAGTVFSDSRIALGWVRKGRSAARPDLDKIIFECKGLVKRKRLILCFVPRGQNLAGLLNDRDRPPVPSQPRLAPQIAQDTSERPRMPWGTTEPAQLLQGHFRRLKRAMNVWRDLASVGELFEIVDVMTIEK